MEGKNSGRRSDRETDIRTANKPGQPSVIEAAVLSASSTLTGISVPGAAIQDIPVADGHELYKQALDQVQHVVAKHRGQARTDDEAVAEYDLERDVNAYLIQYTRQNEPKRTRGTGPPTRLVPGPASPFGPITRTPTSQSQTAARGPRLEPVDEELTDGRFKGRFPDQRMAIRFLLGDPDTGFEGDSDANILSKTKCDEKDKTRIRYFHIPANNMDWVERTMTAYYGEKKRPDLGNNYRGSATRSHAKLLLRPEFWRGQQHGSRSGMVHARHMRTLCERVSSDPDEIEDNPKNIVLFMPYLHWETDRMRETMAKAMSLESEKECRKREQDSATLKAMRQGERRGLRPDTEPIRHPQEQPNEELQKFIRQNTRLKAQKKCPDDVSDLMTQFVRGERNGNPDIKIDSNGRLVVQSRLGQYLIDAARLYEAMSTFRDQKMIEGFLYNDPPLHPRRTLDQSYYWTLKSTKARDRDQVVYRGTTMNLETCHRLIKTGIQEQKATKKAVEQFDDQRAAEKQPQWQWTGHWKKTDEDGCEHCKNDIRKISQVVMVDQLWMWVLDERTIITSFPRRYGFNKHDLSGVHRSIRARLKTARTNQIRSVYDLALIILDECSNTFFDRTKTRDSQPQVIDIFSEAIGNLTHKHTISFQRVWHWTSKASSMYRAKSKHVDSSELHIPLLDINPEGKLQREIKDIIDELDIMLHIYKQQREVIKRFCKHVEHILDPEGKWKEGVFFDQQAQPGERSEGQGQLLWFRMQSRELLDEVDDRIGELEGLRKAAESTAQSVNDLLSLKQQQASVVQAWESVRQAEESVRQGRAIMVFTIFTIIFLPLSFMSSLFGMNNVEFGDGTTITLQDEFRLMFPVSLSVILISLTIAYSALLRAVLTSTLTFTVNWLLVKSGIYRAWLMAGDNLKSNNLLLATEKKVKEMKEEVKRAKLLAEKKRKMKRREREEGRGGVGEKYAERWGKLKRRVGWGERAGDDIRVTVTESVDAGSDGGDGDDGESKRVFMVTRVGEENV
ncbi:hypothetical protein VTI74DRAFT_9302 [Chaetomium olivicolor]